MSVRIRRVRADRTGILSTDLNPSFTHKIYRTMGILNLAESEVVWQMRFTVSDNTAGAEVPLAYPVTPGRDGQMIGYQALVRNSTVVSENSGVLNKSLYQNIYHTNTDWYLKSRAREDCDSYGGTSTNRNYGKGWADRIPDCPFVLYTGARPTDAAGTWAITPAQMESNEIRFPYKHIDQFGQFEEYPIIASGNQYTTIQLENQIRVMYPAMMPTTFTECLDVASVAGVVGAVANPLITTRVSSEFNRIPKAGDAVTFFAQSAAAVIPIIATTTIAAVTTAGPGAAYSIVLTTPVATANNVSRVILYYGDFGPLAAQACYPVANMNSTAASVIGTQAAPLVISNFWGGANQASIAFNRDCPFYVGCPVVVTGARGNFTIGDAARGGFTTVAGLARTGVNGVDLSIFLTTPVPCGGAAAAITNIRISHRDYRTNDNRLFTIGWTLDEPLLELHSIQTTPSKMEEMRQKLSNLKLDYLEWDMPQYQMATGNEFERSWHIPPYCLGWHLMTPMPLTLVSGFNTMANYMIDIQGEPILAVGSIPVGNGDRVPRGIHNHMVNRYFNNMQKYVSKYDAQSTDYRRIDDNATHAIYPCITPIVPTQQMMKLRMQTNGNAFPTMTGYFANHTLGQLVFGNGTMRVIRGGA